MMAAKPLIEQREALLRNKEEEKKRKQVITRRILMLKFCECNVFLPTATFAGR